MMNFADYKAYTQAAIDSVDVAEVEAFIDAIHAAFERDATIFVIGNGGSAASASHLAQDLAKGTCLDLKNESPRVRALSLADNVAYITALGNDEGYDQIFVQQLRTFHRPGDMLIAISGSGNSPNILRAVEFAGTTNVETWGITGFDGGALRTMATHCVHVPLNDMCTAESVHTVIFHYVILRLREKIAATATTNGVAD